ncbi:hypothetical protein ACU686_05920 [Yinghuangia aomiensis]
MHLDRALTWEPTGTDPGGRDGATRSWRAWPARYGVADLRRRAHTALLALSANGVTAVRAHVDVGAGAGSPLRAVEILRDLREDLYRILDLQVVAVPSPACRTAPRWTRSPRARTCSAAARTSPRTRASRRAACCGSPTVPKPTSTSTSTTSRTAGSWRSPTSPGCCARRASAAG